MAKKLSPLVNLTLAYKTGEVVASLNVRVEKVAGWLHIDLGPLIGSRQFNDMLYVSLDALRYYKISPVVEKKA
jgi:hypothetical protein